MYNFLYSVYYLRFGNGWVDWFYGKSIIRIMNVLFPLYFSFTCTKAKHSIESIHEPEKLKYIVSLTTFPARISKAYLTIETILRQDVKPDAIMLWLFKGEFPDKAKLPKRLLAQEKRGLQIRFCEQNLMPHKKYYYTLKEYPNANVITVDDDTFYPLDFIENLINQNLKSHNRIICFRAREIRMGEQGLLPYQSWNYVKENTKPHVKYLPIGVGGVLYPPGSLHMKVLDFVIINKLALRADDLWLKVMSLLNNTQIVCLGKKYPRYFMSVRIPNNERLEDENIAAGKNDKIVKVLLKHFGLSPQCFLDN